MRVIDMGNNEQVSIGINVDADGYTALTLTQSKTFKTRKGAEKWLAKRGYTPMGASNHYSKRQVWNPRKMKESTIIKTVRSMHGAVSVSTIANRLGAEIAEVAEIVVKALESGKLVEHPTIENIYGLPQWY